MSLIPQWNLYLLLYYVQIIIRMNNENKKNFQGSIYDRNIIYNFHRQKYLKKTHSKLHLINKTKLVTASINLLSDKNVLN